MKNSLKRALKYLDGLILRPFILLSSGAGFGLKTALPPAERVLVLAPHIDDEVLGAGGTLLNYTGQGAKVQVVYLTNGSKSYHPVLKEQALVAARKQEAQAAAKLMGYEKTYFMDRPDGSLSADGELIATLSAMIERFRPDVLILPFFLDRHPDHVAANKITFKACKNMKILAYSVASPLTMALANLAVDISAVYRTKQEALLLFKSQTISFDGILDFNRFNSVLIRGARAVELFYFASLEEYAGLFAKLPAGSLANEIRTTGNPLSYLLNYFANFRAQKELKRLGGAL